MNFCLQCNLYYKLRYILFYFIVRSNCLLYRTFYVVKQVAFVDKRHYFSYKFEENDFSVIGQSIKIIKIILSKIVLINKTTEVIVLK